MLSLERVAVVKIAATLWNQDNIRTLTTDYRRLSNHHDLEEKWLEIEQEVTKKVPHLPLPESLKEEILAFIKPIGMQILKWSGFHFPKNSYIRIDLPKEFSWTSQGTIDKKKTVEPLIKDESLAAVDRFLLACIYCLEDDIPKLWSETPPRTRNKLCCKLLSYPNVMHRTVVMFWLHKIGGIAMEDDLMQECKTTCFSSYQHPFEEAARDCNKEATEYFLPLLTPDERKYCLGHTPSYAVNNGFYPEGYSADVLFFLLSQMDEKQLKKTLKMHSHHLLQLLLCWPLQSLFIETANLVWDFLRERDYDYLLKLTTFVIKDGFKDYNYQELFREFWQQSPNAQKRYAIDECIKDCELIRYLSDINDEKNIKLILKDSNFMDMEKDKLIFIYEFCAGLINEKKWDLLKFIIQECISSRNNMIRFKEEIISFVMRYYGKHLKRNEDKYNKFFQLLNDSICGFDKRKIEEDNGSPAKRHHHTEFEEVSE